MKVATKLSLNKETLKALSPSDAAQIDGGFSQISLCAQCPKDTQFHNCLFSKYFHVC